MSHRHNSSSSYRPQQSYGGQYNAQPPPSQGYSTQGYNQQPPYQGGGGHYNAHSQYSQSQSHGSHGYGQGAPYGQAPQQQHTGGFHAAAPPPPPGADPQLWGWFTAADTDRSGAISVRELQLALKNGDWSSFDLDTVQMLMNIFDTDRTGTISFHEFGGLWKYIQDWQNVFRHFDADRSGTIEQQELSNALRQFGYNLSPQLLDLLTKKFGSVVAQERPGYGPPPGITFDRFVRACICVKSMTEAFQKIDTDRDGWIRIDYNQLMNLVLMAP